MRIPFLFLLAIAVWTPVFAAQPMELTSQTFTHNATLPKSMEYDGMGCTGDNQSPQLSWSGAPEGTKSYVVMMHDPDAPHKGGWWHWSVYNIPADVTSLEEGSKKYDQGMTSFEKTGWGGMCPPVGHGVHHYNFTVYALNMDKLDVEPKEATPDKLKAKMEGHILGRGELTGLYQR